MNKDRARPILAGALVAAYIAAGAVLCYVQIPKDNKDFVNFILGGLATFTGAAIFWYFGDSKGKSPAPPPEEPGVSTAPGT